MRTELSRRAPLTLERMLQLDSVAHGSPELLTAEDGLSGVVRWVHVSEELDIADSLLGGEVIVCSGRNLATADPDRIEQYVSDLAERQVSGLVVRGEHGWKAPAQLLQVAETTGLPVIRLHRPVNIAELMEEVHDLVLGHRLRWMRLSESLRQEFVSVALATREIAPVASLLAQRASLPVVIESRDGQILAASGPTGSRAEALREWAEAHGQSHPTGVAEGPRFMPGCAWTPIVVDGHPWATVHVLGVRTQLDDALRAGLDAVVPALRVARVLARDEGVLRLRSDDRMILDLSDGRLGEEDVIRSELGARGAVVGRAAHAFVLSLHSVGPGPQVSAQDASPLIDAVRRRLPEFVAGRTPLLLLGRVGDDLIGIIDEEKVLHEGFSAIGSAAKDVIEQRTGERGWRVAVGVSSPAALTDLASAIAEARDAVRFGGALDKVSVHHFSDFRLHRLLSGLTKRELDGFVARELGPVMEQDRTRATELMTTLEVYFAHSRNATSAAAALFVERRSLYHRLQAVERLTGRNPTQSKVADAFALALAAWRVAGVVGV